MSIVVNRVTLNYNDIPSTLSLKLQFPTSIEQYSMQPKSRLKLLFPTSIEQYSMQPKSIFKLQKSLYLYKTIKFKLFIYLMY